MSTFKKCITASFLFVSATLFANTDKQLWFGFIQQARVTKHWGYWLDIHHRTKNDFTNNLHVELVRAGGTYFINDHFRVTVGYAYAAQFPSLTNQSFVRQEHRPWQQFAYTQTFKKIRVVSRLRSEQRLIEKTNGERIAEGYHFRQRFRVNAMVVFALCKNEFKKGGWGLVLHNEFFVNAYSTDKVNAYDQNRAFAGISYNITNQLQLHFGYMNLFAKTPKGDEVIHAIRLFAFHAIDFRKKSN
ncbi:MAG: DUF2490 domain-containing protein [Chitinophagales bacterium]|nr:DUF2490 domain-containing protein [Chitinophagales bacterium]